MFSADWTVVAGRVLRNDTSVEPRFDFIKKS